MDVKTQRKSSNSVVSKAVKSINKLIDDGRFKAKGTAVKSVQPPKPTLAHKTNLKNRVSKGGEVFPDRGVVYLGHIPHGFYEEQMKGFFSQFGHVTRLRLVRSHKTGNSKGYAFIEFRFKEVAQVVADTMNNYLMRNRLLKAQYIPPKKVHGKMFEFSENYGPETCIGVINRRKVIQNYNKNLPECESDARLLRHKQHLIQLQEKLKAQGVDCVFQIDDSSSMQLLEGAENSTPAAKRPKVTPSNQAQPSVAVKHLKQTNTASTLKKTSNPTRVQTSLKSLKPTKIVKSATDKSMKKVAVKVEKNKIVEKKPAVKKVVKKNNVVKAISAPKKVAKKSVAKKQVVKK